MPFLRVQFHARTLHGTFSFFQSFNDNSCIPTQDRSWYMAKKGSILAPWCILPAEQLWSACKPNPTPPVALIFPAELLPTVIFPGCLDHLPGFSMPGFSLPRSSLPRLSLPRSFSLIAWAIFTRLAGSLLRMRKAGVGMLACQSHAEMTWGLTELMVRSQSCQQILESELFCCKHLALLLLLKVYSSDVRNLEQGNWSEDKEPKQGKSSLAVDLWNNQLDSWSMQPLHNSVPLLQTPLPPLLIRTASCCLCPIAQQAENPSCVCNKSFTLGCSTTSYMVFYAKGEVVVSPRVGMLDPFLKLDMSLSWQDALTQEKRTIPWNYPQAVSTRAVIGSVHGQYEVGSNFKYLDSPIPVKVVIG